LNYVADLRLHPIITFLNYGLRVSVSSDANGLFHTNFLNWDFYACAFSMEFDLFDFKKICNDSIECSCLEKDVKEKLRQAWEKRWEEFVNHIHKYGDNILSQQEEKSL